MSEHAFSLTAGIVFLLIALAHLVRLVFGAAFVVQGVSIPLWASVVALLVTAFLSYEGFHFARKANVPSAARSEREEIPVQ
jgi:hypothetical protein